MRKQPPASEVIQLSSLLILVSCFALGIWLDRILDWPLPAWGLALAIPLLIWIFAAHKSKESWLTGLLLLVAWVGAGGLRHHLNWNVYSHDEISLFAGESATPVLVKLRMDGEPRRMATSAATPLSQMGDELRFKFPATAVALNHDGDWIPASGNLNVFVRGEFSAGKGGDLLRVAGLLARPEPTGNPGEFPFGEFARGERRLVWLQVRSPDAITVIQPSSRWFSGWRSRLRQRLDSVIWQHVKEEQAPLASAILLGNRNLIASDQLQSYLLTGTIHVLSISGLHVGIMAGGLFLLLRLGWVPRRTSLAMAIVAVLGYAWAVEFSTPVTRAAILITLFCLARMIGLHGRTITLLSASALIVLLLWPSSLFSVGAQLSFLAVAILVWSSQREPGPVRTDPLKNLIAKTRPAPQKLLNSITGYFLNSGQISGAVWLLTMPLVAARFHIFSPVSMIVNPLIMLPMATALYGGMIVMVFGGWLPPLAALGGWVCSVSLSLLEWLVEAFARIPGGTWWVVGPGESAIAAWFAGLFCLSLWGRRRFPALPILVWTVLWSGLGWWLPGHLHYLACLPPRDSLELTVVDVGHGNANLLRWPNGRTVLYDCGSFGSSERGVRNISACLWAVGVTRIEDIIISHADVDHFNALPGLCSRFRTGRVWITPQMARQSSASVSFLISDLKRQGIAVHLFAAGQSSPQLSPATSVTWFAPPPDVDRESDNANSLVVLLDHLPSGQSLFLTGDLEGSALDDLTAPAKPVTVAVAPHHGSLGSRPAEFCARTRPRIVIISADKDRLSSESLRQYGADGRLVLSTGKSGAVRLQLRRDGIFHKSWGAEAERRSYRWNADDFWSVLGIRNLPPTGIRDD